MIKDLRFPRIIIALFTGAALAVSGVLFSSCYEKSTR
ncbi:iron chelate uptake ABC transporter family permease subunit [Bacillus pacificus]